MKAMADNGIKYCVGDNSVKTLVPANKYHAVSQNHLHLYLINSSTYLQKLHFMILFFSFSFDEIKITSTVATHGYAGILIIPREAYDIDYGNSGTFVLPCFSSSSSSSSSFCYLVPLFSLS